MFDLNSKTTLDTSDADSHIDNKLRAATTLDDLLPPTTKAKGTKAISIASFAASYPTKIRPILVMAAGLLKFFRRGDSANAVTQTVSFLDLMISQGEVPGEV